MCPEIAKSGPKKRKITGNNNNNNKQKISAREILVRRFGDGVESAGVRCANCVPGVFVRSMLRVCSH